MIYGALLAIFGPSVTPLAKEFGLGDTVKMTNLKAVYYPIWRIDCIAKGGIGAIANKSDNEKAWLAVREGYVPGKSLTLTLRSFQATPLPLYRTSHSGSLPFRTNYPSTIQIKTSNNSETISLSFLSRLRFPLFH